MTKGQRTVATLLAIVAVLLAAHLVVQVSQPAEAQTASENEPESTVEADTIRVKHLQIVDDEGRERIRAQVDPSDAVALTFFGPDGKVDLHFGAAGAVPFPILGTQKLVDGAIILGMDGDGKTRLIFTTKSDGSATFALYGSDSGAVYLEMKTTNEGAGLMIKGQAKGAVGFVMTSDGEIIRFP